MTDATSATSYSSVDTAPARASATPTARSPRRPGPTASLGLLVLRVVAGSVLAVHGVQNLLDAEGHIAATARFGIPFPEISGWLSMLGEAGLGVLLVFGALTRVAGVLAALLMAMTFAVVHLPQGLIGQDPGVNGESALLIGAAALALALVGPGAYAVDRLLFRGPTAG